MTHWKKSHYHYGAYSEVPPNVKGYKCPVPDCKAQRVYNSKTLKHHWKNTNTHGPGALLEHGVAEWEWEDPRTERGAMIIDIIMEKGWAKFA